MIGLIVEKDDSVILLIGNAAAAGIPGARGDGVVPRPASVRRLGAVLRRDEEPVGVVVAVAVVHAVTGRGNRAQANDRGAAYEITARFSEEELAHRCIGIDLVKLLVALRIKAVGGVDLAAGAAQRRALEFAVHPGRVEFLR